MTKLIHTKRSLALAAFGLAFAMLPDGASAASMEDVVCNAIEFVTGPTGAAIATVAILILGIAAFFGKVTWGLAVLVAIGMAGLFGAAAITEAISDQAPCA